MALYHNVKGSVNYTKVGNPTIVDGVASGFSVDDYLTLPEIDLSGPFEMVFKFTTPAAWGTAYDIVFSTDGVTFQKQGSSRYLAYYFKEAGASAATQYNGVYTSLQENTVYYVKIVYDGATVTAAISTDGTTWQTEVTANYTGGFSSSTGALGRNRRLVQQAWGGAIDLNSTYITANGQPLFGLCPVEVKKVVRQGGENPAEVSGVDSLSLPNAQSNSLTEVKLSGGCEQNGTPTPNAPIDIISNNGALKVNNQGQIYTDGTQEVVTDSLGNTANAEMLLAFENYKDTQEVLSGAVTRNLGIKVFDGSEDWYESSLTAVIRGATEDWGAIAGVGGYCTHLDVLKSGESTFAGACRFASDFNVYYYKDAFGVSSISGFKQYLAQQYANGTPVIIVYPLATSTTETVTAQPMNVQTGNNTLSITQASMSDLGLSAKYTKNLSDVNYVVKDGKLVFADSGLYLTGPNNYTVVGTPTITDGIASGFSENNYLSIGNYSQLNNTQKIEMNIVCFLQQKTIHNPGLNKYGYIIGSGEIHSGIQLIYDEDSNALRVRIGNGTASEWTNITNTFAYNKLYKINIVYEGQQVTTKVLVDGAETTNSFTSTYPCVFTANILLGNRSVYEEINGSIDLNETYIKVNDQLWFYGKNYASQNIAPVPANYSLGQSETVGYTVVGSPTISDGIVSGFSDSNYLQLNSAIPSSFTSADILFRGNISDFTSHCILLANTISEQYFGVRTTNQSFSIYNSGWTTGTNTLNTNTWYWFRVVFDGTNYIGYTLADNNYTPGTLPSLSSWDQEWTTSANVQADWIKSALCTIGTNTHFTSEYFRGSIDLNNTIIKINGQVWFGTLPIGYIDMRTQAFTAAPSGATLERDE